MGDLLNNKARSEMISKFKKEREKKNFTQEEVAEKAGINKNYYAKVERGEANPSLDTLLKIAKALGLRSSSILPF